MFLNLADYDLDQESKESLIAGELDCRSDIWIKYYLKCAHDYIIWRDNNSLSLNGKEYFLKFFLEKKN